MSVALQEELPLSHPMRPLLLIHTYGTTTVNRAAVFSLCVENGLLHRASAFTWDGVCHAFKQSIEQTNHDSFDLRDWTTISGTAHLSEQVGRVTGRPILLSKYFLCGGNASLTACQVYPYGSDLIAFYDVVKAYVMVNQLVHGVECEEFCL